MDEKDEPPKVLRVLSGVRLLLLRLDMFRALN